MADAISLEDVQHVLSGGSADQPVTFNTNIGAQGAAVRARQPEPQPAENKEQRDTRLAQSVGQDKLGEPGLDQFSTRAAMSFVPKQFPEAKQKVFKWFNPQGELLPDKQSGESLFRTSPDQPYARVKRDWGEGVQKNIKDLNLTPENYDAITQAGGDLSGAGVGIDRGDIGDATKDIAEGVLSGGVAAGSKGLIKAGLNAGRIAGGVEAGSLALGHTLEGEKHTDSLKNDVSQIAGEATAAGVPVVATGPVSAVRNAAKGAGIFHQNDLQKYLGENALKYLKELDLDAAPELRDKLLAGSSLAMNQGTDYPLIKLAGQQAMAASRSPVLPHKVEAQQAFAVAVLTNMQQKALKEGKALPPVPEIITNGLDVRRRELLAKLNNPEEVSAYDAAQTLDHGIDQYKETARGAHSAESNDLYSRYHPSFDISAPSPATTDAEAVPSLKEVAARAGVPVRSAGEPIKEPVLGANGKPIIDPSTGKAMMKETPTTVSASPSQKLADIIARIKGMKTNMEDVTTRINTVTGEERVINPKTAGPPGKDERDIIDTPIKQLLDLRGDIFDLKQVPPGTLPSKETALANQLYSAVTRTIENPRFEGAGVLDAAGNPLTRSPQSTQFVQDWRAQNDRWKKYYDLLEQSTIVRAAKQEGADQVAVRLATARHNVANIKAVKSILLDSYAPQPEKWDAIKNYIKSYIVYGHGGMDSLEEQPFKILDRLNKIDKATLNEVMPLHEALDLKNVGYEFKALDAAGLRALVGPKGKATYDPLELQKQVEKEVDHALTSMPAKQGDPVYRQNMIDTNYNLAMQRRDTEMVDAVISNGNINRADELYKMTGANMNDPRAQAIRRGVVENIINNSVRENGPKTWVSGKDMAAYMEKVRDAGMDKFLTYQDREKLRWLETWSNNVDIQQSVGSSQAAGAIVGAMTNVLNANPSAHLKAWLTFPAISHIFTSPNGQKILYGLGNNPMKPANLRRTAAMLGVLQHDIANENKDVNSQTEQGLQSGQ